MLSPSRLVTLPHPAVARQVPLEATLPAAPVRQDSPLLERPDSRRVKVQAERFVVAREIAREKLA